MEKQVIQKCPACGEGMKVTALECPSCHTQIRGQFTLGNFSRLTEDQLDFIEVFVRLRGNIKEVEQELGISYPTVRKRLDEVIKALGYTLDESPDDEKVEQRGEVLEALDKGQIDFEQAMERLEQM